MEHEEWRPVVGYEGAYEVSNLGRVRGLPRVCRASRNASKIRSVPGKIIAPDVLKSGYYKIGLHKNGKKKLWALHQVVALAFVPGRTEEKRIINHKDENPANNCASNLEWCTYRYNSIYNNGPQKRWKERLERGVRYPNPPKPVEQWKEGKLVAAYPSLHAAAAAHGVTPTLIMQYCKSGAVRKIDGSIWKYAEKSGEHLGDELLALVEVR